MPIFSIIMPAFNAASTIMSSVGSVIGQTFADWELIVVDDCSTDDTKRVVLELQNADPRVQLIALANNVRVAGARNAGLRHTTGRYICFLDADDAWLPEKLECQLEAFKAGALVVYSSYFRVFSDGSESMVRAPASCRPSTFYYYNPIGNLTGAYDAARLGKFEQLAIGHEDYLMWFEIVRKAGHATGIARPLAKYRVAVSSLSGDKKKALKWHWHMLESRFGLSTPKAAFAFAVYALLALKQRALDRSRRKRTVKMGVG